MRLVALGHVLRNRRVPVRRCAARMGGDALAAVEYFDGGRGVTGFELLARELIGNTVVMTVDLNVIIDVGPKRLPFRQDVALAW